MTDPVRPPLDWCRHCGADQVEMSFEHLPPRSADNKDPIRLVNDAGEVLRVYNEGHGLPNLCLPCNKSASDRGLPLAYKKWRIEVIEGVKTEFEAALRQVGFSIWRSTVPIAVAHDFALHPGRIARQVLGMLLAIQQDRWLIDSYPQLQAAYFSDDGASIEPLSLHIALANVNYQYFTDFVVQVTVGVRPGVPSSSLEMRVAAFSPFLGCLVEGSDAPWRSTSIDAWLRHPTSYHFRKRDRNVDYWMADRTNLLVAKLYEGSKY